MSEKEEGPSLLARIGAVFTAVYVVFLVVFIRTKWNVFSQLSPNEWGDFLAGSFGPLALAWIVLGFFLQSRELTNSVRALNFQADELRASVEQQKELVRITERQLELDKEARQREAEIMIEHRMPHIILSFGQNQQTGGTNSNTKLNLHNVGASAQSVRLAFDSEYEETKLSPKYFHAFEQGEEKQVLITQKNVKGPSGALQIILENTRQETKVQLYHLSYPEIELIESKIPFS